VLNRPDFDPCRGFPAPAVGRFSSAGGVADWQAAIAAGVAAYRAGAVTR
jgi:hypothetical protein